MASRIKNQRTTLERIEKSLSNKYFADVNIYSRIYEKEPKGEIKLYHAIGSLNPEIIGKPNLKNFEFEQVEVGESYGPTWSIHLFKLELIIPTSFNGREVHLRWQSDAECLLFNEDLLPLQAFSGSPDHQHRCEFVLSRDWHEESNIKMVFFVEMQCCDMFGAGKGGMIEPPDESRVYQLKMVEVSAFQRATFNIYRDLELLYEYAKFYGNDDADDKGYQALYAANHMLNLVASGDMAGSQLVADEFFAEGNGRKAHMIHAVGHCHIDSAWLWNYDVTIRKCARSWISTLTLMDEYTHFNFACSQAQQFDWVKENYPDIFKKIKYYVEEGRFIPVGGSWVEMDGNIPSGESFIRQFLYGQKFFQEEFGLRCKEFWLPDTFGYSAQIPQILQHVGITRFLTQKLSWSLVNKFPHHNFIWEGIDGSAVLVHFPPADTYEANCKVSEAIKTINNLKDKGRVKESMMLYGYGDGGGGPTRQMIERLHRLKDVDGIPRMKSSTPDKFFSALEEREENLCRWRGELYLELHNGTYTSQASMKDLNRRSEVALYNTEFLVVVALQTCAIDNQSALNFSNRLEEAWKDVLLNQFHDVLPGSCIKRVIDDAEILFEKSLSVCSEISEWCLQALKKKENASIAVFNPLQWERIYSVVDTNISISGCSITYGYPAGAMDVTSQTSTSVKITPDIGNMSFKGKKSLRCFVLSILNKMAEANFDKLSVELSENTKHDLHSVQFVAEMIHKKALRDTIYRKLYAKLVRFLDDQSKITFCTGREVVQTTLKFYEKGTWGKSNLESQLEQRYQELLQLSNMEFMCYLFEENLISRRLLMKILGELTERFDISQIAIELASKILLLLGTVLDDQNHASKSRIKTRFASSLNKVCESLETVISTQLVEKRVEFMVLDILELKANSWVPRRERKGTHVAVKLSPKKQIVEASVDTRDTPIGVEVYQEGEDFVLQNKHISAKIDRVGRVINLQVRNSSSDFNFTKSCLPMNQFVIFDDIPLYWDAWDCMDYHLETRKPVNIAGADIKEVAISKSSRNLACLTWSLIWNKDTIQQCKIEQDIILTDNSDYLEFSSKIDWRENRKFLKVEFPTCLNTEEAIYEIQFGQLRRPTLLNTSWDWARFEVCGHKWAALSEPGRGIAVLNDSKYGWSGRDGTLILSLLRSPKSPDNVCDMREHKFRYAVKPFMSFFENSGVVQSAKEFNSPLIVANEDAPLSFRSGLRSQQWFFIETDQEVVSVVLEAVKLAEKSRKRPEDSPYVILRLYEAHGTRAFARIATTLPFGTFEVSNGLEDSIDKPIELRSNGNERYFEVPFAPFEIRSFLLH